MGSVRNLSRARECPGTRGTRVPGYVQCPKESVPAWALFSLALELTDSVEAVGGYMGTWICTTPGYPARELQGQNRPPVPGYPGSHGPSPFLVSTPIPAVPG
eukprot:1519103-Rhodomonas_salina.2